MSIRNFRKAFTLAESLAASVILAVAVVGVSGALLAAQQQTRSSRQAHVLTMLARQLVERATSLPMQLSDGTSGVAGWPAISDANQYDTLDDFAGYTDSVDASAAFEQTGADASALVASGAEPVQLTASASAAGHACVRTITILYPTTFQGVAITHGQVAVVTVAVRLAGGATATLSQTVCKWTATRSN